MFFHDLQHAALRAQAAAIKTITYWAHEALPGDEVEITKMPMKQIRGERNLVHVRFYDGVARCDKKLIRFSFKVWTDAHLGLYEDRISGCVNVDAVKMDLYGMVVKDETINQWLTLVFPADNDESEIAQKLRVRTNQTFVAYDDRAFQRYGRRSA